MAGMAGYTCMMVLKLQSKQVHLWFLSSGDRVLASLCQDANHLISQEELARSQMFLTRQARDSYLTSRAFLRSILSQYIDVSPQSLKFHANAYGKLEIASPAPVKSLRFNLANTDGLVTCAVGLDRDIGVDAEVINDAVDSQQIAERFFAPAEVAALRKLAPDERQYRFFEFWTLKESFTKALGLGLSVPLNRFAFVIDRKGPIEILFGPSCVDDPRNWHFSLLQPVKGYLIAVALSRLPAEEQTDWRAAIELDVRPFEQCSSASICSA
jgi:4'-phosphopantetheinyl transferase